MTQEIITTPTTMDEAVLQAQKAGWILESQTDDHAVLGKPRKVNWFSINHHLLTFTIINIILTIVTLMTWLPIWILLWATIAIVGRGRPARRLFIDQTAEGITSAEVTGAW